MHSFPSVSVCSVCSCKISAFPVRDLNRLGKRFKEFANGKGPRGPNERARVSQFRVFRG